MERTSISALPDRFDAHRSPDRYRSVTSAQALGAVPAATWQPTMAGWLASKAVWPTLVEESTSTLVLGADTVVTIRVAHAGAREGRDVDHIVTPTAAHDAVAPNTTLHVVPPCPPYTAPTQEPGDNTLAARSKRFAQVTLRGADQISWAQLWVLCYVFFTLWPDQEYFVLVHRDSITPNNWLGPCLMAGLGLVHPADIQEGYALDDAKASGTILISRAAFWQGAGPHKAGGWVPLLENEALYPHLPQPYCPAPAPTRLAMGIVHPARLPKLGVWAPANASVPLYRRYIPELRQTLTFRLASSQSDADIDLLHRWHASDRVNIGWRQDMPRDAHRAYLADMEATSHSLALIGEWDGEPFGYVEIYYAKEDALHNYFDAGDYDTGFHALVGEERFRGPHRVRSWMGSVLHLLFLLDARTMRVVSEPRASNTKMVEYECMCGGHVDRLVDLPHKRAALVFVPRERYFQLCPMGPLPEPRRAA